ncbi:aminoglycoside phosphotransferase family protein [Kribbella sandramycini]|uniref:Aminoglycoside phosphotransferase family protein n=1 Tax=Kribbella sandramycini TaxID=60450 RepID=A0A7Y4L1B2_9ACTN|nr:spectinomycin phosphotransferase [Kribbella sandramycini]NOL42464.1 aminoglycoside phosphotransferase family protein [Kribbella sandramycini]
MGDTLLRRWLYDDFGLDVVELSPVGYGADLAAQVWRATTATNAYAVKWSGAGTNTGHQVAAYLGDSGLAGVPEVVRTVDDGLWTFHGPKKRLTVTPWVDGVRAAESGLTVEQWAAYGVLLRRVHDAEPPARLRDALPTHSPVDARVPAVAAEVRERLEAPSDAVEAELAALWAEYADTIDVLLISTPPAPTGPRVVCHGDPHLGNVLVADGRLHLIDWDDVVLAPREQDLMFMLGGMGDVSTSTPEQVDAFLAGYGPHPLDHDAVRYYRHVRAREDVVLWSHQALTGPDRADCVRITRGVLAEGLVALAVS